MPHNKLSTDAYSTSALFGLKHKSTDIASHIAKMLTVNPNNEDCRGVRENVIAIIKDAHSVPHFLHPIVYEGKAYIDVRPFCNKEGGIRVLTEFTLAANRGAMDLAWDIDKESFFPISAFTIDVFSSWVSYGLQRRNNVSLLVASFYRVVAAIYYYGLFDDSENLSRNEVNILLLQKLPRMLGVPAQLINDVLMLNEELFYELYTAPIKGEHGKSRDRLTVLCECLTAVANNGAIIDRGVLKNTLCTQAALAANAIEIVQVSLEHPSTFITLISESLQKGYSQNTTIGKTVGGLVRRYNIDTIHKFLSNIYISN